MPEALIDRINDGSRPKSAGTTPRLVRAMHSVLGSIMLLIAAHGAASACLVEVGYAQTLQGMSPEKVLASSDVIVDGVLGGSVGSGYPNYEPLDHAEPVLMKVTHVWKGEVGSELIIYLQDWVGTCKNWPPRNVPIRLAGRLRGKHAMEYGLFGAHGVPIDPAFNRALQDYAKAHPTGN